MELSVEEDVLITEFSLDDNDLGDLVWGSLLLCSGHMEKLWSTLWLLWRIACRAEWKVSVEAAVSEHQASRLRRS